jgi:hypothetical protein
MAELYNAILHFELNWLVRWNKMHMVQLYLLSQSYCFFALLKLNFHL